MSEKNDRPGDEPPLFSLLSDHPIGSEPGKCNDLLDLHERLRVHLDTLRHPHTRTPFSIALYGGWGTGKTSAMRWLENQLHRWNVSDARDKDKYPRLTTVWFYPWKYHDRHDVWRGIIAEVILATLKSGSADIDSFSKKAVHVAKRYGKFLGSSFLHILANTKIKGEAKASAALPADLLKAEAGGGIELDGQAIRDIYDEYQKAAQPHAPFLNDFEEEMKNWVKSTFDDESHRLVIFIDDLDRCLPEVALEVLEALKLYLNIPGLLFVAGLDDHVIGQIIVSHYSKHNVDEAKARQYLAKIFQVEYHMEPSEAKASGFLDKRIAALNQLTDGKWSECLPTPGPEVDALTVRYRPAVEKAISALGSSNPREFTRLLNSLLVRAVAARQMKSSKPESTPQLRFAQGAQTFLIEQILIRHLDLGPARRNPLLNTQFCEWLELLSTTRGMFSDANEMIPDHYFDVSESAAPFASSSADSADNFYLDIVRQAAVDTPHALEALKILYRQAWDLLLIPFSKEIAAATATIQALPPDEKASSSEEIINTAIRLTLGLRDDQPIGDTEKKAVKSLRLGLMADLNDISALRELTNLEALYLRYTSVSDVTALQSLRNLKWLELSHTPVSDVKELQSLTSLETLDLRGTQVSDVTALHALKDCLKLLGLNGTPVSKDKKTMVALREALPHTDITPIIDERD